MRECHGHDAHPRHLQGGFHFRVPFGALAFDGDADRVFLVDERARPVSGSTTTALVASNFNPAPEGGREGRRRASFQDVVRRDRGRVRRVVEAERLPRLPNQNRLRQDVPEVDGAVPAPPLAHAVQLPQQRPRRPQLLP